MLILNLGCGTKTSDYPGIVNIDWSVMLRVRKSAFLNAIAPVFLSDDRLKRLRALSGNILVYDLRKGIPFGSDSVDAVYHSHVMEHLDRPTATSFAREVIRVLKPGGVQRVVVPDLEKLCRKYLRHIADCETDPKQASQHDLYVAELLEQSVRKEASGTASQRPLRRYVENMMLGDARSRGETHQWMYDRINLPALLRDVGFREVRLQTHLSSAIPNWEKIGLDLNGAGEEYKPESLYIEAIK